MNIDFVSPAAGELPHKKGFAATGQGDLDYWNRIYDGGTHPLLWASGSDSPVTITLPGFDGCAENGMRDFDVMYDTYCYANSYTDFTISNLPAGCYCLHIYGHGGDDYIPGCYDVFVGTNYIGYYATYEGGWNDSYSWQQGGQYVSMYIIIPTNQPQWS